MATTVHAPVMHMRKHKTRRALQPAEAIGFGGPGRFRVYRPPGGSWRTKAATQLPRGWLASEIIVGLTNTPKLALEHVTFNVGK